MCVCTVNVTCKDTWSPFKRSAFCFDAQGTAERHAGHPVDSDQLCPAFQPRRSPPWECLRAEISWGQLLGGFFWEVLITEITQWWVHAKSWIILWKPTSRPARGVPKVEARPSTSSLGGLHPYLLCKSLSAGYLNNADIGNPPECSWIFAKWECTEELIGAVPTFDG